MRRGQESPTDKSLKRPAREAQSRRKVLLPCAHYFHRPGVTRSKSRAFTMKILGIRSTNEKFKAGERHLPSATLASPSWLRSLRILAPSPSWLRVQNTPLREHPVPLPFETKPPPCIHYFHAAGVTLGESCAFTMKIPSIMVANGRSRAGKRHLPSDIIA